jgi:hypothetical protein
VNPFYDCDAVLPNPLDQPRLTCTQLNQAVLEGLVEARNGLTVLDQCHALFLAHEEKLATHQWYHIHEDAPQAFEAVRVG